MFGLIWDDIDFVNKTITVNRQVQWYAGKRTEEEKKRTNGTSESNGYWYFCEPKYKSYRTIDIDDTLLDILKEEYEKQQRACKNQRTGERGDTETGAYTGNAGVFRNCDTL